MTIFDKECQIEYFREFGTVGMMSSTSVQPQQIPMKRSWSYRILSTFEHSLHPNKFGSSQFAADLMLFKLAETDLGWSLTYRSWVSHISTGIMGCQWLGQHSSPRAYHYKKSLSNLQRSTWYRTIQLGVLHHDQSRTDQDHDIPWLSLCNSNQSLGCRTTRGPGPAWGGWFGPSLRWAYSSCWPWGSLHSVGKPIISLQLKLLIPISARFCGGFMLGLLHYMESICSSVFKYSFIYLTNKSIKFLSCPHFHENMKY